MVDGYRGGGDPDAYVTYNTPGRQVGRFTLRGGRTMFLFVFRDEHDNHGLTPKQQLHNQFSRKLLLSHSNLDGGNRRFERVLCDLHRPAYRLDFCLIVPQAQNG